MHRAVAVGVPVAYVTLAALMRIPLWQAPTTSIGGTGTDPSQTAWFLAWVPYAISHHMNPLVTHALNAPAGVNLMWNTGVPAAAVLLWPVTAIWNSVVTFNVIVTGSLALSAWLAYLALRRYVRPWWAAALGGLLFGFSPLMSAQEASHANIVASAITVPLALMLLDEALLRQRLRWWITGLLLAAVFVLQCFIFEEFFVTMSIAAAVLVASVAIVGRSHIRQRAPHAARAIVLGALLTALLLVYPVWVVQLHGPDVVSHSIQPAELYSTNALNFVIPTHIEWLSPRRFATLAAGFSGNASEADAYLGIPLLLVVLGVLVWRWRDPVVRVAGAVAVVIALFSLGPFLHVGDHRLIPLPWWVPAHLPLLDNVLPSRMAMFMYLAIALLFARALEEFARFSMPWRAALPLVATAAVLITIVPRLPFYSQPMGTPAFFSSPAAQAVPADTTVYAIPTPDIANTDAMKGQLATDFAFSLVGGYFIGPQSPGQDALRQASATLVAHPDQPLSPALQTAFLDQLRSNRVGAIALMPTPRQASVAAYLTTLFGGPAEERGGVVLWLLHGASETHRMHGS